MIWYIPCKSGDFRLSTYRGKTRLTIADPTDEERERLNRFLVAARDKGWVETGEGYQRQGTTRIQLACTVPEAAAILVPEVLPKKGDQPIWTAVRRKDGHMVLYKGRQTTSYEDALMQAIQPQALAKTEAAVTLRAPKRGCPEPIPCNRRASEVLRAFSTRTQIASYQQHGFMVAYGNRTGHPYRIHHRNEAARRRLSRAMTNHRGWPVCVWDWSVPPEEETLGLKLCVEHDEERIWPML